MTNDMLRSPNLLKLLRNQEKTLRKEGMDPRQLRSRLLTEPHENDLQENGSAEKTVNQDISDTAGAGQPCL